MSTRKEVRKKRVVFVHPDLGIGGAERLVVDAAAALQGLGHKVTICTARYDPKRCFREVGPDGSIAVDTIGSWIPRTVGGRLKALLTAVQCMYIAMYLCTVLRNSFDVAICDIVSSPNAVFRLLGKPVVFYCHFPDKLLARSLNTSTENTEGAEPLPRRLYRSTIDCFEEFCMKQAEVLLVNSKFTASKFCEAFRSIRRTPRVVYPYVEVPEWVNDSWRDQNSLILLSLNRYERKKGIDLAILALDELRQRLPGPVFEKTKLVICGGWDERLVENAEVERELRQLARSRKLDDKVEFHRNVSDAEKFRLLSSCRCLLYTPQEEHFGIVPVEAMAAGVPVIACNSGGPLETIEHRRTGFLCNARAEEFAAGCVQLLTQPRLAQEMGRRGRDRVQSLFSRKSFAQILQSAIYDALLRARMDAPSGRVG
mmetsp:Transcript_773/g.2502  ORF Transcript_773/g.2502 Transcript_773/m.2502 type:complete len:426 (+) Transcript_773:109-1386(+)